MTGLESVLLSSGLFLLGGAVSAVATGVGKLSKKDHDAACPQNREVIEKKTLVDFGILHDKECGLKLKPIYDTLDRIELQNEAQFKQQTAQGLILNSVAEKIRGL